MVNKKKIQLVEQVQRMIEQYPVVGLLDMQNLPARQLKKMKALLRQKGVTIAMTRKKLLQLALKNAQKENIPQLAERLSGMPALLLTNTNPFSLYALLEKNKSSAPARPGQLAPKDIIIPAGPTNFAPGPIISELGAVGIKTGVEGGKLVVKADTTLVKEGQPISQKIADVLKRFDIQPMEIGLNLRVVWESGLIFDAKQLRIDEQEYQSWIIGAVQSAFNVAVDVAYLADETVEILLGKAVREAREVSVAGRFTTTETTEEVIMAIEREALLVSEEANVDELMEQLKATSVDDVPVIPAPTLPAEQPEMVPMPVPPPEKEVALEVKQVVDQFAATPPLSRERQDIKEVEDFYQKLHQEKMQKMKLGSAKSPSPSADVRSAEQLFSQLKREGTLRKV